MGEEENSNTFCLTLPIVQDMTITLTPETKAEPEPVSEVPVEVEQGEKKDNRPTVLVVEDNPDMQSLCCPPVVERICRTVGSQWGGSLENAGWQLCEFGSE